jgi:hypothetical protein
MSTKVQQRQDFFTQLKELIWSWFSWCLIYFRWIIIVPVVLPMSFLFDKFWIVRNYFLQKKAPQLHDKRVQDIQKQIQHWIDQGRPGKLCTARKNWLNTSLRFAKYKEGNTCNQIKIELYDVLGIDTERRIVRTEPMVNMGQITQYLIPQGYTLPVIPELDDLTISGLILGYGIEASSHKYGLFSDIVQAMEVVTGDGKIVRCTRTENADLFYALPWSYGALGFLVAVELDIIPVKKYAHITYTPFYNYRVGLDMFEKEIMKEDPVEFIDVIYYSKDRGVIVSGDMVDHADKNKVNNIGWWFKPWFHKYVEAFLDTGRYDEYIPIRQYYHRYTRSLYWQGDLMVPFGNNVFFRLFLGWLMPPRVPFLKLTGGPIMRKNTENKIFVQDVLVPIDHLKATFEFFHDTVEVYPLWLVGHKLFKTNPQGFLKPKDGTSEGDYEMYVDVGAWYVPKKKTYNAREDTRKMEAFCREHRGYQCLYAHVYQTQEEYEQMFDTTLYKQLRTKYNADGFLDVYEKIKKQ